MLYYLTLALISSATIILELALLRLFAVQQFYHFAFMAISLALLGAGASGSILSVRGRRFSPVATSLLFSLTTVGAYLLINYLPFDSFSIAWDSRQILYLAGYFLAAAVPFLFAGLVIGGELTLGDQSGAVDRPSHLVYGANLIGSSVGSIASLLILDFVGGTGAILIAAILGAVCGSLFTLTSSSRKQSLIARRITLFITLIFAVACLWILIWRPNFWEQRLSPYKALSVLSQALDTKHVLTKSNETARIDIIESGAIHIMPGLSLKSPAGPPPQAGLLLDGDNLMPLTQLSPNDEQARVLADYVPTGLAWRLRPQAQVLVIEAGTGMEVLFSLAAGAEGVTAVEENRLVNQLLTGDYAAYTAGLYQDPRVQIVNQSGRVFSRSRASETYDLVLVALTDPHRPVTSGAYSLTENYVYTVEAVQDYLRALKDDGLLIVTRWLQTPPSESVRTFATLATALRTKELEPADRIAAFRTLRTMTFLVSQRPFTTSEIETIRDFLTDRNFDAVYFPGIKPSELNRYNLLEEPVYNELFQQILDDPESVYRNYRFDIRPTTDNWPFFYHFFKWRQTPEILASFGLTWQPFGGSGYFVLVALLILVGLASTLLIVGPMLLRRSKLRVVRPTGIRLWRPRVFTYFACLGMAFLFVEIPLAQRFILVLDQPVIALAIVLFAILLFSGIGSLTVQRWRLPTGLGLLVILIILYPPLLDQMTTVFLAQPAWSRLALTILAIAPLGYFMGLPFAAGLQVLTRYEKGLIPWAWAINGSFSVVSSVLAVMVALSWGFSAVLWLGATAYAGALIAFGRLSTVGNNVPDTP